ncbi:MAG: hypothetical protein U9Q97_10890 [Acidobacteriota bacterium]|nr:hypothetical protein [Acidobacteriota bacterium]
MRSIIRGDITIGNSEYRAVLKDLQEIVRLIETKVSKEEDPSLQIEEINSSAFAVSSIEEALQILHLHLKEPLKLPNNTIFCIT